MRHDDREIARLASLGIVDVEDDPTVVAEDRIGPRLWFSGSLASSGSDSRRQ